MRIRAALNAVFSDRLRQVVLYGSEARGSAAADSDIDLLVVLEGPVRLGADTRAIVEALYPLQLEVIRPLHALPVDAAAYEAGEYGLYREARREGIAA